MIILPERIQKKIMPEPMSGCWLWTGSIDHKGYGRLFWREDDGSVVNALAHRLIKSIYTGRKYGRLDFICHECDNPQCVNPDHTHVGTPRTNMIEAAMRGRKVKTGKLTYEKYQEILERKASGFDPKKLAAEYGISISHLYSLASGHHWNKEELDRMDNNA